METVRSVFNDYWCEQVTTNKIDKWINLMLYVSVCKCKVVDFICGLFVKCQLISPYIAVFKKHMMV